MHNNNGNAHCTNSVTVDEQELLNEVKAYLLTAIEDKKAFADKLMKQYQAQTTNVDVSKLTDTRQALEKRRSKFKEMFAADIITVDELKKEMSAIDEVYGSIDESVYMMKFRKKPRILMIFIKILNKFSCRTNIQTTICGG